MVQSLIVSTLFYSDLTSGFYQSGMAGSMPTIRHGSFSSVPSFSNLQCKFPCVDYACAVKCMATEQFNSLLVMFRTRI